MPNKPAPLNLASHPLDGVTLIEASAGTGKTYTITHLYLRALLEKQLSVKQILVVTFTNAATQELRGRIRQLTHQLWLELSSPEVRDKKLDALFGQFRQQPAACLQLQQALVNFDEASIFSIHGFCQRVLNSFPIETQSLLQQEIISDEKELMQAALHDFWRRHINTQPQAELKWILQQWPEPKKLQKAIEPLLKNIHLLEDAEDDSEELLAQWKLLLQQWRDERAEIKDFVLNGGVLNKGSYKPATLEILLQQFDAFDESCIPNDLPPKKELFTLEKLSKSMNKNCSDERLNLSFFSLSQIFFERHADWLKQKQKNLLLKAARDVHDNIVQSKRAAQHISFDDLIGQLSDALTENASSHAHRILAQKIIENWPMAMVDEFQDTDQRQYHIFNTLYRPTADQATPGGLILIGDPKQAIYSFRGADVFTYQQAKAGTSQQFTLEVNYRSTADYVDMVNRLFSHNEQAFVFRQLIEYYPSMANPDNEKKLLSKQQDTLPPLVSWIKPWQDKPVSKDAAQDYFANLCADEIAQILTHNTLMLTDRPAAAKDLVILVRTGRQASLMKQQLAQRGISSALILRDSVFASEQARDITLLLEVLINPADISRLGGLLSTDLFGWNAAQIARLQSENDLLVEYLDLMKQYQQRWLQQGILSMFFQLLADQQTLARARLKMDGERCMTNWLQIVELLQQQSSRHASHSQALHWLLLQRDQAENNGNEEHQLRLESDSDLVRIVTIHKSKGLQYPVVFLPFMWSVAGAQKIPSCYSVHDDEGNKRLMILDDSAQQRWQQENLAEEVRLFYVAMTRAVYRCYLGFGHINGAGGSALAQCLFSDKIKRGRYGLDLDIDSAQQLLEPFEVLNAGGQRLEIIQRENTLPIHYQEDSTGATVAARQFSRPLARQWQITSYSQLALSASADSIDRPDYDAVETRAVDEEPAQATYSRFTFQKGAKAGTFLHDLLEHQTFDQAMDAALIEKKSQEYGFDEAWLPCLTQWMQDVLDTDLNGFALSDLKPQQTLREMEFYLSCDRLRAAELNRLLFENHYSQGADAYHFSTINGFLKGFIDLVFEHDGRYFVADYKSNYLGARREDYDLESCRQAMFEHHYHLQYLIYTLALHRYLQQRLAGYDYERDIGGVYYLFLRGMAGRESRDEKFGVFFDKPSRGLIEKLDVLFRE